MKLVLLLVCSASILFAQAPPITGVGHDAVTTTTARIHWTAGFYHDTASDTKLTVGFTTVFAPMNITVASTAGWHGWNDSPSHIPTTFIMGGEWGRVVQVLSSTTATVSAASEFVVVHTFEWQSMAAEHS